MVKPTSIKNLIHFYIEHVTPFEVDMMRRFFTLRNFRWIIWVFKTASSLGDWSLWVATGSCLLVFADPHINRTVLAALLAVGLSALLFMAVKNLVGRPRPFESWHGLNCLMAPPDKFSFPSGHTMTAFAIWSVLSVGLPILSQPYLLIAILIGLSRVFLGLHYPTDVLVGAAMGSAIGFAMATLII